MTDTKNPYQSPAADVVAQPVLGTGQDLMPARRVRARRGAAWIGEAFSATVSGTPGWILFSLLFALIYLPILGASIFLQDAGGYALVAIWFLYYPLVTIWWGGAIVGCHPDAFRFARAWRGIREWWKPMLTLGLLVGIASLPGIVISGSLGLLSGDEEAMLEIMADGPGLFLGYILGMTLFYSILFMGLWFAPALVVLGGVGPGRALWLSAKAAFRNTLPLMMFGLVVIALFIALMIVLSIAFAVVIGVSGLAGSMVEGNAGSVPVMIGSVIASVLYALMLVGMLAVSCQAQYSSYLDVFAYGQPAAASAADAAPGAAPQA